jgi:hypothetical protein
VLISAGSNGTLTLESGIAIKALKEQQWTIEGKNLQLSDLHAFDYSGRTLDLKLQNASKDAITFSLPTSLAFIRLNGQYYRLPVSH